MVYDRQEHIHLLNQDLMGEHQAIVHYLTHAWTVVRQFGGVIEAIARDEMRHFKWLAHAIVAIGGTPDLTPPDALPTFSGLAALSYDIDAEEEAIDQYLAHQRAIADERVQNLLGRIVVDERYHRRRFMELRDQWVDEGGVRLTALDLDSETANRFKTVISKEYQQILRLLLKSFLYRHVRHVGLDAEDRAIDEMKHMSWLAETLADLGGNPHLQLELDQTHVPELELYRDLRRWADSEMKELSVLIDRIIDHETYHQEVAQDSGWTVGSAAEGGWE